MPAAIRIAPIAPDNVGRWRAFHAELAGPRRIEWVQSQRRRGIRREIVWLDPEGPMAYYLVEAADPDAAVAAVEGSEEPFEIWYRETLADLHPSGMLVPEPVFDSSPKPGAWRGLAGLR